MPKGFIKAWVALFVAWMIISFVVHGVLLKADYTKLPQLFRNEADAQLYFGWMLLAHVVLSGAFVWVYQRGIQTDRPWLGQGVRFGIAMALLTIVPTYLVYYAVQPLPGGLVMQQIALDTIGLIVLGALVAWLHRRPQSG
jgi:hypothetical protein